MGCSGVNYKIVLNIDQSQLVWVNSPFPAGKMNDIKMFQEKGLKEKIPNGKKVVGDLGYQREQGIIVTKNHRDPRKIAEFKERVSS